MKKNYSEILKKLLMALVILSLMMVTSCSSTIKTSWVGDTYNGKAFQKVMIITVAKRPGFRKSFEYKTVEKLSKLGYSAYASLDLFPENVLLTKDEIRNGMIDNETDAILLVKFTGVETKSKQIKGKKYGGKAYSKDIYYEQYSRTYNYVQGAGYLFEKKIVSAEIKFYDIKTEQKVWSVSTTTTVKDSIKSTIDDFVKSLSTSIVNRIDKEKLLISK